MRCLLFSVILFIYFDSLRGQTDSTICGDIVTFKNQTTVKAKILEVNDGFVTYKRCANLSGPSIIIPIDKVSSIKYAKDSSIVDFEATAYRYKEYQRKVEIKKEQERKDLQNTIPRQKNAIYITIGGLDYVALNINYERHLFYLTKSKRAALTFRSGFGAIVSLGGSGTTTFFSPNLITGRRNAHFELGIGLRVLRSSDAANPPLFYQPAFNLGYRYQSPEHGFVFRIGICSEGVFVSFGAAFKKQKRLVPTN